MLSEKLYRKTKVDVHEQTPDQSSTSLNVTDDTRLAELGYKSEFRREFSVGDCVAVDAAGALMLQYKAPRDSRVLLFDNGRSQRRLFDTFLDPSFRSVTSSPSSIVNLLFQGGHVGLVWGWIIPFPFIMCVAAVMAEMASSMP